MLMKAMQVVQPRSFVTVQVPIPHLTSGSPDRLLIQTRWASMCGSDIPFFTGNKRFKPYPLAPGAPIHECVGQVVESTSDLFRPGDHVVAIPEGDQGSGRVLCGAGRQSRSIAARPRRPRYELHDPAAFDGDERR